jgi:hypothetical protein
VDFKKMEKIVPTRPIYGDLEFVEVRPPRILDGIFPRVSLGYFSRILTNTTPLTSKTLTNIMVLIKEERDITKEIDEREAKCADAALVLANFDGKDPSSLQIVDDFVRSEFALDATDMIAAYATNLADRSDLIQGNFLGTYEGLEGTPKGEQIIKMFKSLGKLGQLILSPKPGAYGDLILAAHIFYRLDRQA